MKNSAIPQWQSSWGTPFDLIETSHKKLLDVAFLFALVLHAGAFGLIWREQMQKKLSEAATATLQSVDLIEPELEQPVAPPPPPVVEKPKSALDFLKMALPKFSKPAEAPRDIVITPKIQEPKIAEPEKLMEKKMPAAPLAPEIKLDSRKPAEAPKILDLARAPAPRTAEPRTAEPALKLEEVGRKAVAPAAPAISLERSARDRAADLSALPQIARAVPGTSAPAERIVDKGFSSAPRAPAPLSYARPGPSVSLDQPRDIAKAAPKPVVQTAAPVAAKSENPAKLEISKDKVRITGPLAGRKVVRSIVPQYPAWAKARGIEADVAIRFTVSSAGDVIDNAVVERTSGYTELDRLALDTVKLWKFTPLAGSENQWGVITFRFLLD
jgi:TonB family protein